VRAQVQAGGLRGGIVDAGQHQHRLIRVHAQQPCQHRAPIHVRHVKIEDDQAEFTGVGEPDRLLAT
jgi:hypothetical protein